MDFKNWYCVQVAAGCEKKAQADLLARKAVLDDRFIQNVEVPETTELKVDKAGKRKTVKTKLLPGYIIVQVMKEKFEDEDGNIFYEFPAFTQETINSTFNVLGFTGMNRKKPRMMKPSEVKTLFDRVDDTHLEVKANVQTDYDIGDILDVVSGPFAGYKAEVFAIQGDKIKCQLDMFGRIVPAEFTKEQVYKK